MQTLELIRVPKIFFEMGGKAKLTPPEWLGVFTSLGVSIAGIWLIRVALVDPEPTSKLWLLLAGGVLSIVTGGGYATYILTKRKPPNIKAGPKGIEIVWT